MVASTSIRIPTSVHTALKDAADERQLSLGTTIEQALEALSEQEFWAELEQWYRDHPGDPATSEFLPETIMDGLENEEPYYQADDEVL